MIGLVLLVLLGLYTVGGLLTVAHFWEKYGRPDEDLLLCLTAVFFCWPLAAWDELGDF